MSEDCAGERDRSHVILLTIFIHEVPKSPMRKKRKDDEQTLAELNSVHRR